MVPNEDSRKDSRKAKVASIFSDTNMNLAKNHMQPSQNSNPRESLNSKQNDIV